MERIAPYEKRVARLPIIGFDTTAVWDYTAQRAPLFHAWDLNLYTPTAGMGGLGFVMRDYLMND